MAIQQHNKYIRTTDSFNWYIVVIAEYTQVELDALDEISVSSIKFARYNNAKTKCIMKYRGKIPTLIANYLTYSIDEINTIIQTDEWVSQDTDLQ